VPGGSGKQLFIVARGVASLSERGSRIARGEAVCVIIGRGDEGKKRDLGGGRRNFWGSRRWPACRGETN